jgi:bisphosphoglycerate-dependent phosphoglycerate mutase
MGQAKNKRKTRAQKKTDLNKKVLMDYCTASPDFNFSDCCKQHDEDYEKMTISRWRADKKLRRCISKKGVGFYKYRILPWVYWAGVRAFGGMYYGNDCRKKCKICDYLSKKTQKIKGFFL